MQLTARLFNATIVAADGEVPVWDPSVRFFKVYRDGALKGHLYIDPYARPGGKLLTIEPQCEYAQACACVSICLPSLEMYQKGAAGYVSVVSRISGHRQ